MFCGSCISICGTPPCGHPTHRSFGSHIVHLHAHTNSCHAHMQPAPIAPAPPRRAIKACADGGSSTVRSAADFVMVTYHSPLTLLRRWPCTPHSHPAQLVAGARDTVAGGTRRGTRVASAPLCGNGAAVPSSNLGAFSRPVPPPSTDDRRKDVRPGRCTAARWRGRQLHGSTRDGYLGA